MKIKAELGKHWKSRAILWLNVVLWGVILYRLTLMPWGALLIIPPAIIIDEYLKEGYCFNAKDLGKFTHESIFVIVSVITSVKLLQWLRKKRKVR